MSASPTLKLAGSPVAELLEGLDEYSNDPLRGDQQVDVVEVPIPVGVRGDGGALVGVGLQVEEPRHTRLHEGLAPNEHGARRALLGECEAEDVRIGMRVEALWLPKEEWSNTFENIKYFRPTGEPDIPVEKLGAWV